MVGSRLARGDKARREFCSRAPCGEAVRAPGLVAPRQTVDDHDAASNASTSGLVAKWSENALADPVASAMRKAAS